MNIHWPDRIAHKVQRKKRVKGAGAANKKTMELAWTHTEK